MTDRDAQMLDEYIGGREVADIAARYAVPEAYVSRLIEEATTAPRLVSRWSLAHQGNRIGLAVLAGWIAWFATGGASLWIIAVAGVVVYALITAVAGRRA